MRRRLALTALFVTGLAASAQPPARDLDRPGRRALEQRFRDRLREVVRQRLDLTDEQAIRLADVNLRFEERRSAIIAAEIETRRDLRRELAPGATPNQERVGQLLDRALRTQREQLALIEAEQRELAAFLTPVQRARYFGLQEQLRTQINELRERRVEQGPGRPLRRRPPPL